MLVLSFILFFNLFATGNSLNYTGPCVGFWDSSNPKRFCTIYDRQNCENALEITSCAVLDSRRRQPCYRYRCPSAAAPTTPTVAPPAFPTRVPTAAPTATDSNLVLNNETRALFGAENDTSSSHITDKSSASSASNLNITQKIDEISNSGINFKEIQQADDETSKINDFTEVASNSSLEVDSVVNITTMQPTKVPLKIYESTSVSVQATNGCCNSVDDRSSDDNDAAAEAAITDVPATNSGFTAFLIDNVMWISVGGGLIVILLLATGLGSFLLHKKRQHELRSHLLKNDTDEDNDDDELHRQDPNVAAKAADKAVVPKDATSKLPQCEVAPATVSCVNENYKHEKTPGKETFFSNSALLAESEKKVVTVVAEVHNRPASTVTERQAWATYSQELAESMTKNFHDFDREMALIRASDAARAAAAATSSVHKNVSMFETENIDKLDTTEFLSVDDDAGKSMKKVPEVSLTDLVESKLHINSSPKLRNEDEDDFAESNPFSTKFCPGTGNCSTPKTNPSSVSAAAPLNVNIVYDIVDLNNSKSAAADTDEAPLAPLDGDQLLDPLTLAASQRESELSEADQLNGSENVNRKDVATSCSTNSSQPTPTVTPAATPEKSKIKEAKDASTSSRSLYKGMTTRFRKKFHPQTKF